jgi:phage baseplate assembly protein V
VRVEFGDRSNLVSYELPVMVKQTLKNKDSYMPDIGEHVLCSFLGNGLEQGFVLGAIYSNADTAVNTDPNKRGVTFEDGTEVYYDRSSNKLNIIVAGAGLVEVTCKTATVNADTKINLTTPEVVVSNKLTVNGLIDGKAGATLTGGGVTHNGKNIGDSHTHIGSPTAPSGPRTATGAPN